MQRRSFLGGLAGILASGAAPAIVATPMKIWVPKPPKTNKIVVSGMFGTYGGHFPYQKRLGECSAYSNLRVNYERVGPQLEKLYPQYEFGEAFFPTVVVDPAWTGCRSMCAPASRK